MLPPQPQNPIAQLWQSLLCLWQQMPESMDIDCLAADLAAKTAQYSEAVPVAYLKKESSADFNDLSVFLSHYGILLQYENMPDMYRLSLAIEKGNDFVWILSSLGETRITVRPSL